MTKESILMAYNFDNDIKAIETSIINDYKKPLNYYIPNILLSGSYITCNFFEPLLHLIQYNGNIQNYKYERYSNLMDLLVKEIIKVYSTEKDIVQLQFVTNFFKKLLSKITGFFKGQNYLRILNNLIKQYITIDATKIYLMTAASHGTIGTFIYWLDYYHKNYYKVYSSKENLLKDLDNSQKRAIFVNAVGNSDDRIYKYVLKIFLEEDKLFFQKDESIVTTVCVHLLQNKIPEKYVLKRIKLLSNYISLVPYFFDMVTVFTSEKIIFKLHQYYYKTPYTYINLKNLMGNLALVDWEGNMINGEPVYKLYNLFLTEEEKCMFLIILSIKGTYSNTKFANLKLSNNEINKIIIDNYKHILNHISFSEFMETLNDINFSKLNKKILATLTDNNLITKYIEEHIDCYYDDRLLFLTKFVSVGSKKKYSRIISVNYCLHLLRIKIRKVTKNKVITHKIRMHTILRQIENFEPNKKIPILKLGSKSYQQNKQKFNNIPPRHLLPGEFNVYDNILLKDKADGVLINNLPIGIYPNHTLLNNYQIKAEYIEELDLYLIFDIDIPKTTIIDRYNILRSIHNYTKNTKLEKISDFDEFITCLNKERENITIFLKENRREQIKWYPKFATYVELDKINKKDFYNNIVNKVIIDCKFIDMKPYNCDGLIMTPINGEREIKIKPLKLMTIDLLYSNNKWLDGNNKDYTAIIDKKGKRDNKIYRCYPTLGGIDFTVGELRFDKKKPNKTHVIDSICNILNHNWEKEIINKSYYYESPKKFINQKLVDVISSQRELLTKKIESINPTNNYNWLDLGSGSGKLIPIIKKYNPSYYLGIDADVNQLSKALKYHNENDNIYHFTPMELSTWTSDIHWTSIYKKFDYVIANFSIMHFFTETFWENINKITHPKTTFIFNVVANKSVDWKLCNSYMKVIEDKTVYKFEWVHDKEQVEEFIEDETIKSILDRFNWDIINKERIDNYTWWIIEKN